MKHRPEKSENMIKKINRIMQLFYVFLISCICKTKMIFLDLFRILLFSIRIKNVFIQMFIREIISEKFPNDGKTIILKKRIYRSYPFKEVSLQIDILFHQKLIF